MSVASVSFRWAFALPTPAFCALEVLLNCSFCNLLCFHLCKMPFSTSEQFSTVQLYTVVWPAEWGMWFCPSAGVPSRERLWTLWNESRGGPSRLEGWSNSPVRIDWETWGCSAWEENALRCPNCSLPVWERNLQERERHFIRVCSDRRGENIKLKKKREV